MPLLIPNAGDTTSGNKFEAIDQAEPDSLDFEILSNPKSGVLTGCEVTTNNSASNVAVAAGVVVVQGVAYTVAANATLGLPAAPTDNRFDLVVARVSGGSASLVVVQGADSSTNPSFPKSRTVLTGAFSSTTNVDLDTDVVLAAVYRSAAATVTSSRIVDKRVMRDIVIINQGATTPLSSSTEPVGSLYYKTAAPDGTESGVYVKRSNGDWIELAQNVGSHLPIGAVIGWPVASAIPSGCLELNGQALSASAYPALFAVYGYAFGGSGGTFYVPNYNGKFFRGTTSTGLVGTNVGSDNVTLTEAQLPSHTHNIEHNHTFAHTHGVSHTHTASTASGGAHTHGVSGTTGAGTAHTHQLASGFPVIAQVFSSPNRFIVTTATATGTEIIWQAQYYNSGSESAHTHSFTTTSDSGGGHTHTVTVDSTAATTSSQSSSTTSGVSSNLSGPTGSGSSISVVPASTYMRWITRASLGSDPSFTGGSPTDAVNKFSQSAEISSPVASTSHYLWVAAFACTVDRLRAYRTGGTGATVNVTINGSYCLASDLSISVADTWTSALADNVVNVAEGDVVEVTIESLSGTPTDIIMQVDYSV